MTTSLETLRQTPQLTPAQFLTLHPGCWIQYYDDTQAKEAAKALSVRSFDPVTMRRKQEEQCAVCFSLQAFGRARTMESLLCYRNLGVDVDLVSAGEKRTLSATDIDRRKEEYLSGWLRPFPLNPHWLIETGHGFHIIFRIQPLREAASIRKATVINRRLVRALKGDEQAALLTQVLRVPGTYQYKDPEHPFLCRLLLNIAGETPPYDLADFQSVLDTWEAVHGIGDHGDAKFAKHTADNERAGRWREGLTGVPEGQRNAMAASIIGRILRWLPEDLWDTAGWGGLKEWNTRNTVPLPERELRSVFLSIGRRECAKRQGRERKSGDQGRAGLLVRMELRIKGGSTAHFCQVERMEVIPKPEQPSFSPQHAEH